MADLVAPSTRVTLNPNASGAARLAAWQDVMSGSGTVHVDNPCMLRGSFSSRVLGELRTMQIAASTFRLVRDRERAARVPREHVLINLVVTGRIVGRLASRTINVGPGDLLLSRLTNDMDLLLEDAQWLALLLPEALVERRLRWTRALDARVFTTGTVQASLLGGLVSTLSALPNTLESRQVARACASAFALLATCLGPPPREPEGTRTDKEKLARSIRHYIVRRLADPALDVDMIAHAFEQSRSALYRIMGETGDIAAIIRRLRLHAIARDLALSDSPNLMLAEVAKRHGMTDERTFRRAFVREFGCTPSALRNGRATISPSGPVGTDLHRWFLGLD